MFSLRFSMILMILLIIPLFLRISFGNFYEPYPAILLPSGAGKVPVQKDNFTVKYLELYSQDKNGNWIKLNTHDLLYPIPVQYQSTIISNGFGLEKKANLGNRRIERILMKMRIIKNRDPSQRHISKANDWLIGQLNILGLKEPVIKIVQKEDLISTASGKIINDNTVYEKIICLNKTE